MRMVKMQQETLTLEEAVQKFLMEKDAQHTGAAAMTDYRNCLARFVKSSHNSIEYDLLDADVLAFFSSIPDTSPARYNKPFQNVNAFLNWMVEQEYISKSPIKVHKLHKRKDEGNIKPVPVSDLTTFIASLDRRTYTGLRDYVIILLMLDTGVRTKELLSLRDTDYFRNGKYLCIEKNIAKTRKKRIAYLSSSTANILENFIARKPKEWEDWLFPNYEGRQLKVDHLDKSFAKHSEICGVKITPYQLRHSFATLFLKNGGDVFTLQHLMGHADLRMTRRYAELDEAFVEQQHKSFSPVVLLEQAKSNRVRRI